MLNQRYKNDGRALLKLNPIQIECIASVKSKIKEGRYKFESVPCAICSSTSFHTIAEKDRYGFAMNVVICKTCGLVQTNPRMNQDAYNEFYNQEYRLIYGGEVGPTEKFFKNQYYRLGKKIYEFIESQVRLESQKKFVLEIGCGAGGILKYFKDKGCTVKGIDLGEEFVRYGKEVHYLVLEPKSIEDLKLDHPPDIIIYSHVLEHTLDLRGHLEFLKSIMHDYSMLYIEVPGLKNLHESYKNDLLRYLQNAHVYHFTNTSLRNLLLTSGFQELKSDQYIHSLFVKAAKPPRVVINNEYPEVLKYLKRVEWMRSIFPVPPYLLKHKFKKAMYKVLSFLKIVSKI